MYLAILLVGAYIVIVALEKGCIGGNRLTDWDEWCKEKYPNLTDKEVRDKIDGLNKECIALNNYKVVNELKQK